MAKPGRPKRTVAAAAKSEPDEELVVMLPTENQFRTTCVKLEASRKKMKSGMKEVAEAIKEAVANRNLHKGAIGIHQRLDAMDPLKRSELLFHFDQYRQWSDWDDHMDMFREKPEEAAVEKRRPRANSGAVAPSPDAA